MKGKKAPVEEKRLQLGECREPFWSLCLSLYLNISIFIDYFLLYFLISVKFLYFSKKMVFFLFYRFFLFFYFLYGIS